MTTSNPQREQDALRKKTRLLAGRTSWRTHSDASLGITSIVMSDGPHGLRKEVPQAGADHAGFNPTLPATCFPTASALASSFDTQLVWAVGKAIAEECRRASVNVLLGPGVNMKRSPLCGRNFEYYSEDPYLAGALASSFVKGVQQQGVGACLKHFACNSQELARLTSDSIVDERALNEIYLRAFELVVERADPWMVMAAYNKVNGIHSTESKALLSDKLRDEWGWDGVVVTDWGALSESVGSLKAGLDLVMPGPQECHARALAQAVEEGVLDEGVIDAALQRLARLSDRCERGRQLDFTCDDEAHLLLAAQAAAESAVLLKNDEALPFETTDHIAFVGAFAKEPHYQGGGSSQVSPTQLDNAWDCARAQRLDVEFAPGYDPKTGSTDEEMLRQAERLAARCDAAVVFVGLPDALETEGMDRCTMRLPEGEERLIARVAAANDRTIVVLSCGAPVETPWIDGVCAVLLMHLAGCQGGHACIDLLFGVQSPCGKLAETWPVTLSDTPLSDAFPMASQQIPYLESIFTGYRYYDSAQVEVRFPFGYGLTYTQFAYRNLHVETTDEGYALHFDLENAGARRAKEIVQAYVHAIDPAVFRPEQELAAFTKVLLDPGETQQVVLALDGSSFRYWDDEAHRWRVDEGAYEVKIGASSRDIRLAETIELVRDAAPLHAERRAYTDELEREQLRSYYHVTPHGFSEDEFAALFSVPFPEEPPRLPYTIDSPLKDLELTRVGRLVLRVLRHRVSRQRDALLPSELALEMLDTMPLRSMTMAAYPLELAQGLVLLLNGHPFKGVKTMLEARRP